MNKSTEDEKNLYSARIVHGNGGTGKRMEVFNPRKRSWQPWASYIE